MQAGVHSNAFPCWAQGQSSSGASLVKGQGGGSAQALPKACGGKTARQPRCSLCDQGLHCCQSIWTWPGGQNTWRRAAWLPLPPTLLPICRVADLVTPAQGLTLVTQNKITRAKYNLRGNEKCVHSNETRLLWPMFEQRECLRKQGACSARRVSHLHYHRNHGKNRLLKNGSALIFGRKGHESSLVPSGSVVSHSYCQLCLYSGSCLTVHRGTGSVASASAGTCLSSASELKLVQVSSLHCTDF